MPDNKNNLQNDVLSRLQQYFDGLYHADCTILEDVFHPDARYINMTKGDYMNLSLEDYLQVIDKRIPPAASNEIRHDKLLSIDFSNQSLAFVKCSMTMMGREYQDLLTFTCDSYGWRIMSKIFTYTQIESN